MRILKFTWIASYSEIQVTRGPWERDCHMKWRLTEDRALNMWGEQHQSELQYTRWGGDKMSWDSGRSWRRVFCRFCPAEREEFSNHISLLKLSMSGNHLDSHTGTQDFPLPHFSLDITFVICPLNWPFSHLLVVKVDGTWSYTGFWQSCSVHVSFPFVPLPFQLCHYSPRVLPRPPDALFFRPARPLHHRHPRKQFSSLVHFPRVAFFFERSKKKTFEKCQINPTNLICFFL